MRVKYLLASMVALLTVDMLTGLSYAAIDPESAMGMWLFDDEGDPGMDSSGNGNDGSVEGNPEWTDEGKFDGGLHFDAVDDVVKVPMLWIMMRLQSWYGSTRRAHRSVPESCRMTIRMSV
jgi:hypothetical protein